MSANMEYLHLCLGYPQYYNPFGQNPHLFQIKPESVYWGYSGDLSEILKQEFWDTYLKSESGLAVLLKDKALKEICMMTVDSDKDFAKMIKELAKKDKRIDAWLDEVLAMYKKECSRLPEGFEEKKKIEVTKEIEVKK